MPSRYTVILLVGILGLSSMVLSGCPERIVFVTDGSYPGGSLGGLDGADAICQTEATEAGLSGIYRAWLSDSVEGPDTRFLQSTIKYVLVDGTLVAGDWADLTDGNLLSPINVTGTGLPVSYAFFPWTNTLQSGEPNNAEEAPVFDCCDDWTSYATAGRIGNVDLTNWEWTEFSAMSCGEAMPLFCFQQ